MFDRYWRIRDRFGRDWRISTGYGAEPDQLSPREASNVMGSLLYFAFGSRSPYDRVAMELFEIHNELTRDRLSHDEWVQTDSNAAAHIADRIARSLNDAVLSGWLRMAPEAELAVPLAPDQPVVPPAPPAPAPVAKTWFELEVLDEVGEPVAGVDVAFDTGEDRRVVPTNGSGVARLADAPPGSMPAAVASAAQLREKLAPRWTKARTAKLATGPDVHVAELDAATESRSLRAEQRATLVVTPLFRCNELSGVHFAFARSFLLESALGPLSVMAAAIVEDENRRAMIFGHTDAAGSEAFNKELSERRAKVIFAFLTHDTEAWEELWTGSSDGAHCKETWGVKEAQHLLNALGVTDDDGNALVEDGVEGRSTRAAMTRFQRGDYDGARSGRDPLAETGKADRATRKEFLLSLADGVTHDPVPKDRFASIGSSPFMGCGEYNPLSAHARDAASRRTVVFVFDRAAEPRGLPCQLRDLGPCKGAGGVDAPPADPLPDDKPYRCAIYREVAATCPCVQGEELMHVEIQLHDSNYDPCPQTHYEMVIDGARVFGETDSDGVVHAAVRKAEVGVRVTYQPTTEDQPLTIDGRIPLPEEAESDRAFVQRIRNLGFGREGDSDEFAILKFQAAHKKLRRTGRLDDDTKQAVRDATAEPLRQSFDDGARA